MSGRLPKNEAIKKRNVLSKNQIALIMISRPGSNSVMVGTTFLNIVDGVAIKPWGTISKMRCASREPAVTTIAFCTVSIPD